MTTALASSRSVPSHSAPLPGAGSHRAPSRGASSSSPATLVTLLLGSLLFAATGCTGQVVRESDGGGGSGGDGGATATATATATGNGGSGTGGSGGAPAECVVQPEGTGGFKEATCADLSVLSVSNAVLTDTTGNGNGNGQLEAGETAVITVDLSEIAGVGFNWYPGVTFTTADEGASVASNDWLYAILPCTVIELTGSVTVDASVAPGTIVTIRAQAAMLNTECPDAPMLEIPITVH